jgi:hypothetical protein
VSAHFATSVIPAARKAKQQLRKMLLKTRQDLADVDVDQLVESTGD